MSQAKPSAPPPPLSTTQISPSRADSSSLPPPTSVSIGTRFLPDGLLCLLRYSVTLPFDRPILSPLPSFDRRLVSLHRYLFPLPTIPRLRDAIRDRLRGLVAIWSATLFFLHLSPPSPSAFQSQFFRSFSSSPPLTVQGPHQKPPLVPTVTVDISCNHGGYYSIFVLTL